MPSKAEIYNLALTKLGEANKVVDPDEAPALEAVWPVAIRAVMRAHPWDCVRRRQQIPAEATAPAFGWTAQFPWPTDPECLRPLWVEGQDSGLTWIAEGKKILASSAEPLQLRYIAFIEDPTEWDASLAMAVALLLAHLAAYEICRSRTKEKDLEESYYKWLQDARTVDAQQGTEDEIRQDEFYTFMQGGL